MDVHRRNLVLGVATLTTLAGCTSTVSASPGPQASDPVCARVVVALPDHVAGLERRETTAQAAVAWGSPPVVLRCGVTAPGPSTRCSDIRTPTGVRIDWIVGDPHDGRVTYVTYGRVPSVELSMPDRPGLVGAAPVDVADAVALTRSERSCS